MTAPCCGCTLQTGTKIIAILQIIGAIIFFIVSILILTGTVWSGANLSKSDATQEEKAVFGTLALTGILISSLFLIISVATFAFGIILLQGANQRDLKRVNLWFIVNCVLLVLQLITVIIGLTKGEYQGISSFLLSCYFLAVVYTFKKELESESGAGHQVIKPA